MMRRWIALVLAGLLAAVAAPAAAQQPVEELTLGLEALDSRDHPAVRLTVTVPAALGGELLPVDSFVVTENGQPVNASVERLPTEGLEVVMLIDTSGSMAGDPLEQAKAAASSFVGQMPVDVGVAAVAFGEEAVVVAEFDTERAAVLEAIAELASGGETALYDGLIAGTSLFAAPVAAGEGRRVLVLLSDGGDTASSVLLEDSILALLGVDVGFYAIELQTPENDHGALERLALATGGAVVPADDPAALQGIFTEVAALIVNQYDVAFTSSAFGVTDLAVSVAAAGTVASLTETVRYPAPPPPPPPPTSVPAPTLAPQPEPAATPTPLPSFTVNNGWLTSRPALLIGLVTLFVALAVAAVLLGRGGNKARLAAADLRKLMKTRERTKLSTFTEQLARLAERSLETRGGGRLESALETAGSQMRAGEFVVLAASLGLIAFFAGSVMLGDLLAGGILGGLAVWLAVAWLLRTGRRRRAAIAEQLVGTLQLISGSLRAGFGLLQAIDVVAEEAPSPTSDEFHRLKVETHLGRDLDEALEAMARRVGGQDFEWVVEGVRIHREIGGDLADILDSVAETVRERAKLRRQVKALSAEGRLSAVFLIVLPIVMAVTISITNPGYLQELTDSSGGRIAMAVGLVLMGVGAGWMRRITRIEI